MIQKKKRNRIINKEFYNPDNNNDLIRLIKKGSISSSICPFTKKIVTPNSDCYVIEGEFYHMDSEPHLNTIVNSITKGNIITWKEAYNQELGYFSSNYDEQTILDTIKEQGFHYDYKGNKINLN